MRSGTEAAKLDPADVSGLAWSAVGLKVTHPERPHRLTLKVKGGEPAALGVALIEPGGAGTGNSPRLLLDACASGPPILQEGSPAAFTLAGLAQFGGDGLAPGQPQSRCDGPSGYGHAHGAR